MQTLPSAQRYLKSLQQQLEETEATYRLLVSTNDSSRSDVIASTSERLTTIMANIQSQQEQITANVSLRAYCLALNSTCQKLTSKAEQIQLRLLRDTAPPPALLPPPPQRMLPPRQVASIAPVPVPPRQPASAPLSSPADREEKEEGGPVIRQPVPAPRLPPPVNPHHRHGIVNTGESCFFNTALQTLIHEPELRDLLTSDVTLAARNRPLLEFLTNHDNGIVLTKRQARQLFESWINLERETRNAFAEGHQSSDEVLFNIFRTDHLGEAESEIVHTLMSPLPSGGQQFNPNIFLPISMNPTIANPTLQDCIAWKFRIDKLARAPERLALLFSREATEYQEPFFLCNDHTDPIFPIDDFIFEKDVNNRPRQQLFDKVKNLLNIHCELEGYCTRYTAPNDQELLVQLTAQPNLLRWSFRILVTAEDAISLTEEDFERRKNHFLNNFNHYVNGPHGGAQNNALNVLHPLIQRPDGSHYRKPLSMRLRAEVVNQRRANNLIFPLPNTFTFEMPSAFVLSGEGAVYEITQANLHSGTEEAGHYTYVKKNSPNTWLLYDDNHVGEITSARALKLLRENGTVFIAEKRAHLPPDNGDGG